MSRNDQINDSSHRRACAVETNMAAAAASQLGSPSKPNVFWFHVFHVFYVDTIRLTRSVSCEAAASTVTYLNRSRND